VHDYGSARPGFDSVFLLFFFVFGLLLLLVGLVVWVLLAGWGFGFGVGGDRGFAWCLLCLGGVSVFVYS